MLDIYEGPKQSNTKTYSHQVFDWKHALSRSTGWPLSLGQDRHEQLLREAELYRMIDQLPKGDSQSGSAVRGFGAVLVKLGCRLEQLGFARLSSRRVFAAAAVDCSCAA